MSALVVSVEKMWSRAGSDATLSDNFRTMDVTFSEAYQVVTLPDATALDVYNAPGLPYAGQTFPGTDFVFAQKAAPQKISPLLWVMVIGYKGQISGFDETGKPKSPLDAPPKIDWDDVATDEEIDEDYDGNPIVNTAGDAIRGVKTEIVDDVLNIQRNFLTVDPYIRAAYRRATNSDTFAGWPPGTARFRKLRATNVSDSEIGYWQVSAQIQFRYPYRTTPDKAWYARVRNEGFYQKVNTYGSFQSHPCVDANKEPVKKPASLNADGTQNRSLDPNTTHWLEFKRYGSLPFNALGLLG
jgi:hypothetical protein